LLTVLVDGVTNETQGELPRCTMFVDDMVLGEGNLEEVNKVEEVRLDESGVLCDKIISMRLNGFTGI